MKLSVDDFSPLLKLRRAPLQLFVLVIISLLCPSLAGAQATFTGSRPAVPKRVTQKIDETDLTTLAGHVSPAANAENDRGPVDLGERAGHIMLLLSRTARQQHDLDALVDQLHNRRSANYHKWLSPEEFGNRFEPADEDVAAVKAWLESKGLTVEEIPPSKTHLTFTGTIGQLQDAFHIQIHHLSVDGEAHESTMNEPQIPAALAPVISGFHKLNDLRPKPQYERSGAFVRDSRTGKATPVEGSLTGRSIHNFDASGGNYEVGPQDFYTIYDENPLLSAGVNGAGQTIAVIEEVTVNPADVTSFRAQFGLPTYPAIPNAVQGGVNYIFGAAGGIGGDSACVAPVARASDKDEEGEADLDLQWAGTVAPNATIDFVACGPELNTNAFGSGGVDHAAQHVVNYLSATVTAASLSYGWCESSMGTTATGYYNNQWEQFAAEGITAIVSSGDSGTTACNNGSDWVTVNPSVNGLGSSAYNVSAGGTDFGDFYESNGYANIPATTWWGPNTANNGSALSYIPEIAWGGGCSSALTASVENANPPGGTFTPESLCNAWGPFVEGGSGGISTVTTAPTWQSVYGAGLYSGSSTYRTLPDLAMFAAAGWWYHSLPYCQSDETTCTTDPETDSTAGGTSFVAPMLNGLMALINQKTGTSQGQADYTLYNLAAQEYGTPGAPNSGGLAACSGSALGANIGAECIFQDIAADTPSLQGGSIASDNVQPCRTGNITDCHTSTPGDTYGLTSIPGAASSTLAYSVGAGYDMITGLGSVNIANLVNGWSNSSVGFASNTGLGTSAGTIDYTGSVTLTATVTAIGRGGTVAPAGVVNFYENSTSGTLLGQEPIVQNCTGTGPSTSCDGIATLNLAGSALTIGSNSLVAYFEGDGANDDPSTSAPQIVTLDKASQTITFAALPAKTYGAAPFGLSATASSGLTVSFASATKPVCTVSGSTVTLVAAGNCIIWATQAGNADYIEATAVSQTFAVHGETQTITFPGIPATPLNGSVSLNATATSGLPVSYISTTTPVCTVSTSTVTLLGVGTCSIEAKQAGNTGWDPAAPVTQSFKVTIGAQTITFGALPAKTYGDAPFGLSATASSGLTVSFASTTTAVCTVSGTTVTLVAAGNCTIRASQAGSTLYAAAPNVYQTFSVHGEVQTITFPAIPTTTLATGSLSLNATSTSGLPVSYTSTTTSVCTVSTSTVTLLTIGTCSIQAKQAGNTGWDPAPPVTQSFKVLSSQTITFPTISAMTYGAAPFGLSATASSGLAVSFASATKPVCTVSGSTVTLVAAGNCIIWASQAGNTVYAAAPSVSQTFSVHGETQTITFPAIPSTTLATGSVTLNATASSGLAVSYTSTTTPVCTVLGSTVTLVTVGACSIEAKQAGDTGWDPAPTVTQSFWVTAD